MSPPAAILEVKTGERPYKCMNSEWAVDSDGPIMFRFISKLCADGQVELVLFSQRQDNTKFIYGTSTFPATEFNRVWQRTREAIWEIFPGVKMEVVDFAEMDRSAYTALPLGKIGIPLILFKSWVVGLYNRLRWWIAKKPPK